MDCSKHKGHRRFVGGKKDGTVDHLLAVASGDYPQTWGTMLRGGQRSWYEIDYEASEGTEVVYRYLGSAREITDLQVR